MKAKSANMGFGQKVNLKTEKIFSRRLTLAMNRRRTVGLSN